MKHYEVFTGRIGYIEDIKELSNGNCVVNFSVAETPRIKKGNEWVDGTTIWTNVAIFGDEARNLHRSVKPGSVVTVFGNRQAREYTVKDTNEKRVVQSVIAEQVSIGITKFNYVEGIGNVNYSKAGINTNSPANSGRKPSGSQPPQNNAPQDNPFDTDGDPFSYQSFEDPFGDDDDPFGLNS
jgi:single-strand DNA-binding protein